MKREDFYKLIAARSSERMNLLELKGKAYAGSDNVFANFERNGERMGLTKYQVWLVYFMKHIDSIVTAIKENPENPVDKSGEPLVGRIDDAVNYLDLLAGMHHADSQVLDLRVAPNRTIEHPPSSVREKHHTEYSMNGGDTWFKINDSSPNNKFALGTIFR